MHNMEMFTKDVLLYMSCSINSCLWLHLQPPVTCCYPAPNLLNNVAVSLLTLSSVLPCVLLVIHAPYDHVIAMFSFINMYADFWSPFHAMYCSVVSVTSSPTCLLIVVPVMSESVISLAIFAWMLPYFLLIFGISAVREFCFLSLVLACHALFFHYSLL